MMETPRPTFAPTLALPTDEHGHGPDIVLALTDISVYRGTFSQLVWTLVEDLLGDGEPVRAWLVRERAPQWAERVTITSATEMWEDGGCAVIGTKEGILFDREEIVGIYI